MEFLLTGKSPDDDEEGDQAPSQTEKGSKEPREHVAPTVTATLGSRLLLGKQKNSLCKAV